MRAYLDSPNARLTDEYPEKFDEVTIDIRGEALAQRVCSIWPAPNAW